MKTCPTTSLRSFVHQNSRHHDLVLIQKATQENRLLMTFDTDFADIRKFPIGSHCGIVVFRLRDQRWSAMKDIVKRLIESDVLEKIKQGLAIVDETRVRFRSGPKDGEG